MATTITGGQSIICSSPVTFGSTDFLSGYQWSTSTNLTKSNPVTDDSMTVTANGQGAAWIEILDGNGDAISTAKKELWLGKPIIIINGPSSTPNMQQADFYASLPSGANPNSYQWILNPQLNNNVYGANTYHFEVAFYTAGSYQVVCRATNDCGTGDYTTKNVEVY